MFWKDEIVSSWINFDRQFNSPWQVALEFFKSHSWFLKVLCQYVKEYYFKTEEDQYLGFIFWNFSKV